MKDIKPILPFIETRRSSRLEKKQKEKKAKFSFLEDDECRDEDEDALKSAATTRKPRGRKRKVCKRETSEASSHSADRSISYDTRPRRSTGGKDLNLLKMCLQRDNLSKPFTRSQGYATVGGQSVVQSEKKTRKRRAPRKKCFVKIEKVDDNPSHRATLQQTPHEEMEISSAISCSRNQQNYANNNPHDDYTPDNDSKSSVHAEMDKSSPKVIKHTESEVKPTTSRDNSDEIEVIQISNNTNNDSLGNHNGSRVSEISQEKMAKSSNVCSHFVLANVYKWMPVDKNVDQKNCESRSAKEQENNLNVPKNECPDQLLSAKKTDTMPNGKNAKSLKVDALPRRTTSSPNKQPEASLAAIEAPKASVALATTKEFVNESQSTLIGISNGEQGAPQSEFDTSAKERLPTNKKLGYLTPRSCISRYYLRDVSPICKQEHFDSHESLEPKVKRGRDNNKIRNSKNGRDRASNSPLQPKSFSGESQASSVSKSSRSTSVIQVVSNQPAIETENPNGNSSAPSNTAPVDSREVEEVDSFLMNYRKQLDPKIDVPEVYFPPGYRSRLIRRLYLKFKLGEISLFDILESSNDYIRECAYEALVLDVDIALRCILNRNVYNSF